MNAFGKLSVATMATALVLSSSIAFAGPVSPQRSRTGEGAVAGQGQTRGLAGNLASTKFLVAAAVIGAGVGIGFAAAGSAEVPAPTVTTPPATNPPVINPPITTTTTTVTTTTTTTATTTSGN